MSGFNPRYVAYASAHDLTPDQMLARDKEDWPGGAMAGFTVWIQDRWAEWHLLTGKPRDDVKGPDDHASFDRWLAGGAP